MHCDGLHGSDSNWQFFPVYPVRVHENRKDKERKKLEKKCLKDNI